MAHEISLLPGREPEKSAPCQRDPLLEGKEVGAQISAWDSWPLDRQCAADALPSRIHESSPG